jgi:hypothetical protein
MLWTDPILLIFKMVLLLLVVLSTLSPTIIIASLLEK